MLPEDEIRSHLRTGQDLSLQISIFGDSNPEVWEEKLQKWNIYSIGSGYLERFTTEASRTSADIIV